MNVLIYLIPIALLLGGLGLGGLDLGGLRLGGLRLGRLGLGSRLLGLRPIGGPFRLALGPFPKLSGDPVAFFLTHQVATDRIPQHFLGRLDLEVLVPRCLPDQRREGIRHRAAQDLRDPGQGFQ